jgi:hypothetical protein
MKSSIGLVVLAIALLFSPHLHAQSPGEQTENPAQQESTDTIDPESDSRAPLASRLTVMTLAGMGTSAGASLLGGLVAAGVDSGPSSEYGFEIVWLAGSAVLYPLSTATVGPLGIYGAGKAYGGKGTLGATYLGTLAGGVVGGLTYFLFNELSWASEPGSAAEAIFAGLSIAGPVIFPSLGGAIGFEMSSKARSGSKQESTGLRLEPTLGVDPARGRGVIGLRGRF